MKHCICTNYISINSFERVTCVARSVSLHVKQIITFGAEVLKRSLQIMDSGKTRLYNLFIYLFARKIVSIIYMNMNQQLKEVVGGLDYYCSIVESVVNSCFF